MKATLSRSILFASLGIAVAVLVLSGSVQAVNGQAQPSKLDDGKFTLDLPGRNPPVAVTQLLLDEKPIPLDTPVPVSGENWVSHIVVEVQNVSSKDVVFGELILLFPETGKGGRTSPLISTIADLGRAPDTAFRLKDGATHPIPEGNRRFSPIRIRPGGMMRFDFSKDDTTQAAAYRLTSQIHLVKILPRMFYFADESKWEGGTYLIPAPPPILWKTAQSEDF
jgi:hypothetical protein